MLFSHLNYCNLMYFGISQSYMNRLQTVQNAAARLLTGTRKCKHITPVLLSLHWLPVHFKIEFLLLVFMVLNGLALSYLSDLLHVHTPARCLRSSNQKLLLVHPRSRLKKKEQGTKGKAFLCLEQLQHNPFLKQGQKLIF